MLNFEQIDNLYYWLSLAPIALFFLVYMVWRARALKRMGTTSLVANLIPLRTTYKHYVKFVFVFLTIAFLVFGFANPQIGTKYETIKRSGVDVIIALDVSKSMLAEDITPSRMIKAKQFVSDFLAQLKQDRIGLIIFAGQAYLQMPLTTDYNAGKMYLKNIDENSAPSQGTAIGEAVRIASESFKAGDTKFKTLIVITDGENHEGDAELAIDEARDQGVIVHCVGVGTPKGAPIPIYKNKKREQIDYKKDSEGNVVLSKLNEDMLKDLALRGNGQYFRLQSGKDEVKAVMDEIARMERKDFEEKVFTDYKDQFQYFLIVALFFMVLEYMISERKNRLLAGINIFK